jgi:trehalose 6-phosphate synthase/phosphatase
MYQYKSVNFQKLAGMYFAADVALITPVRDGMNLVAKEFVSTRIDKRGVLILSDTAGAAAELKEAVIVNPTDRQEIAAALLQALTMPIDEQIARNESMQTRIRNYDVVKWAEDFISQLSIQKSMQVLLRIKEITPSTEKQVLSAYKSAKKRLLLLDYDGTLVPFARTPQQASPSKKTIDLLKDLSDDAQNEVVIVSGRKRDTLEGWLGKLPIGLVAEHGGYRKESGNPWIQNSVVMLDWKEKIIPLLSLYQARCAGALIEEKELSLAWHYRNADKELGAIRARELLKELNTLPEQDNFTIMEGNKVIEIRCKNVHKGSGIGYWLNKEEYDFIFCIGDDQTDEDMFRALPANAFSFRVGLKQSQARFNLPSQADAVEFLNKLSPALLPHDKHTILS